MRFISVPVHNLKNRPLRTLLTIIGIAIGIASYITLIGISRGLESAWINNISERYTHILAMRKGAVEILTGSIREDLAGELLMIDNVQLAAGELLDLASIQGRHAALLVGWAENSYLWKSLHMNSGNLPAPDDSNGVAMGQTIAQALGKSVQDTIQIRNHDFIITGTYKQNGAIGNSSITMLLPTMQKLMDRQGQVTLFNLNLRDSENPEKVAHTKARLEKAFPGLLFNTTDELAEKNQVLQVLRTMTWAISGVALVIALVIILNTLLMSVFERVREIGILSAIGWPGRRILYMITMEGILLSLCGTIAGTFIGISALYWLINFSRVKGFIEFQITPLFLIQVLAVALVLGVLASIYPTWKAINLNPVDALRHE